MANTQANKRGSSQSLAHKQAEEEGEEERYLLEGEEVLDGSECCSTDLGAAQLGHDRSGCCMARARRIWVLLDRGVMMSRQCVNRALLDEESSTVHGQKTKGVTSSSRSHGAVSNIKEWSRLQLVTMTGLVACAVLVVPSTNAVDALKTCACLLKECRIRTLYTGFFTRLAVQQFVQDPSQPAILYNHDNEFLHYQDDWYIISFKVENKEDDYIFVYYRGRNDAWDRYGGVVLYTRSKVVPGTIALELERAAKNVGRDFSTFIRTDNTCGPEPPLVERIEKTVEEGEKTIIREVQEIEVEVEELEKEEVILFKMLADGLMEPKPKKKVNTTNEIDVIFQATKSSGKKHKPW
ncbi:hypothetical protein ABZP36_008340 [Zizania latifolia]